MGAAKGFLHGETDAWSVEQEGLPRLGAEEAEGQQSSQQGQRCERGLYITVDNTTQGIQIEKRA